MGRGLSRQQRKILTVLPTLQGDMDCKEVMTSRDVIAALGLEYTPSARASVSRSLTRLREQGFILDVYGVRRGRQRKGYARAVQRPRK